MQAKSQSQAEFGDCRFAGAFLNQIFKDEENQVTVNAVTSIFLSSKSKREQFCNCEELEEIKMCRFY